MSESFRHLLLATALLMPAWAATADPVRSASLLRPAELRTDKRPSAQVLRTLPPGERVEVLDLEGGWARVRAPAGQAAGWVRAGVLDLAPQAVAALRSGRAAATDGSVTLGIRGGPGARWHAVLVIAERPGRALPAAAADHESALQLARSLGVADEDLTVLRGEAASATSIEAALRQTAARLGRTDGVLVYFAGEGTHRAQPDGGCAEAVLAGDATAITGPDWARWVAPLAAPPHAVLAVIDAGLARPTAAVSRGLSAPADEGRLLPRFAPADRPCHARKDVTTLAGALASALAGRDQVLFISGPGAQALADDAKGGLLTQYLRDCVLRDARAAADAPDAGTALSCVREKSGERVRGALPADAVAPALHGDAGLPLQPLSARSQLR